MRFLRHLWTASKTTRAVVSLAALGIVGAGVYTAAAAMAAPPGPPTPTITGKPANPTSSTSAAFTYSDSQSGTFQCSLDGSAYATCGSGTSGAFSQPVAAASHTFKVRIKVGAQTSGDASYTWLVDTSAPSAPVLTLSSTGSFAYVSGTTAYYNGANGSGSSLTVAASASDSQSGIAKISFPALSGFGGGGADTSSPYSATYTWSSSSDSGSKTVTAFNGAGLTSASSFGLVRDVTAPSGGALTVNGVTATGGGSQSQSGTGSFPINLRTDYAEAQSGTQSGLASSVLTRRQASLGSFSCDNFGGATALSGAPAQSNLAEGCYLYTLTGTDRVGNTVGIATTVVVDKTAPWLAVAFPSNNDLYNANGWNNGCFGTVCGAAADRTGVAQVQLSLQRLSNGLYWDGAGFSSAGQIFVAATVASPGGQGVVWGLSFPASNFPADGQYRVSARGTDVVGNTTPSGAYRVATFTIDRTPPPAPTITDHPANPTDDTKAQFKFTDSEANTSFRCQLDGGSYDGCNGNAKYKNLAAGGHTFCVVAVDQAGNVSSPTCFTWQIGTGVQNFSISGTPLAGVKLYPAGPTVPVNLVFQNPNSVPITIQSVTVSIASVSGDSPPGGCGTGNFSIPQQLVVTPALVVPANSTRSLSQLDPNQSDWPQLQMSNSGNQDACKNATVNLSFTGTAQG